MAMINSDKNVYLDEDFLASMKYINADDVFREMVSTIPNAAAVLNNKRQVVYANHSLINQFGFTSVEELLGRRPGEILSCIHAIANGECGISESCKYCGAYQAIRQTLDSRIPSFREFRVSRRINDMLSSLDLTVSTVPMVIKDNVFMMLYIKDISHLKRRLALERIFFHDVVNKISSLTGLFELITLEEKPETIKSHLKLAKHVVLDMYSEIMAQRQLSEAEHGDLNVKVTSIEILHFLKHIVNLIQEMKVAKDININISPEMKDFSFISDPVILNRVITNLLKNAVEASEPGQSVNIKGEKLNDTVVFTVHNESFIPRNIQLQIFQRSFSTKGEGRGLGTYSIRLLTEQYLKGKVHFTSDENKGTNFHITLPNEIGI